MLTLGVSQRPQASAGIRNRVHRRGSRQRAVRLAAAAPGVRAYTVRKGDTINTIAYKKGLTVEDIQAVNKKVDVREVRPGQTILLPANALSDRDRKILNGIKAKGPRVYPVRKGETIREIAQNRGIPMEKIRELNPRTDLRRIKSGQQILLPPGYYTTREKELLQGIMPTDKPFLDPSTKFQLGALGIILIGGAILFSRSSEIRRKWRDMREANSSS